MIALLRLQHAGIFLCSVFVGSCCNSHCIKEACRMPAKSVLPLPLWICTPADAHALLAQTGSFRCPAIAGVANSKKAGCKCNHLGLKKAIYINVFQPSFLKGKAFGHGCKNGTFDPP